MKDFPSHPNCNHVSAFLLIVLSPSLPEPHWSPLGRVEVRICWQTGAGALISEFCFDHLRICRQQKENRCAVSADVESQTLQGVLGELVLDEPGLHHLENTTLEFQKLSDKEILRIGGPLGADFTVKVRALLTGGGEDEPRFLRAS